MGIIEQLAAFSTMEPAALARLTVSPDGSTGDATADITLAQYFAILAPLDRDQRMQVIAVWLGHQTHALDVLHEAARDGRGDRAAAKTHALILGRLKFWDIAIFRHTGGSSERHFDARVA